MENIKKKKKKFDPYMVLVYVVVGGFSLLCILPFVLVVTASLSAEESLSTGVSFFPSAWSVSSYKYLFEFPQKILRAYFVSIGVTVCGTMLNMFLMVPFAYAISKPNFIFKRSFTFIMFFTVMFSGGIVPMYMLIKQYLGMFDTFWVLFVPWVVVPGHIVLLRVFFQAVPPSLYESAKLDGGSEFTRLMRIGIPLIKPGIAAIMFFSILQFWNDSYTAIIYTENPNLVPVQVLLTQMTQYIQYIKQNAGLSGGMVNVENLPSQSILFAMCVVAAGPMLVLFSFFQKYFVRGLTAGSVKE